LSLNVESGRFFLALNSWVSFVVGVVVVIVATSGVIIVVGVAMVVVVVVVVIELSILVSQCMRLPLLKRRLYELLLFNSLLLRCLPLN
jgi:hypothetical protein